MKIGIKTKDSPRLTPDWLKYWQEVTIAGKSYEYAQTSERHFAGFAEGAFEVVVTPEELQEWLSGNLKLVAGELVNAESVFIIIPKILHKQLVEAGQTAYIEEFFPGEDFDKILRYDTIIDRNGNEVNIKRSIEFMVCRVFWVEESPAQLEAVKTMFNARETDRQIPDAWTLRFNNRTELENFKYL